MAKTVIKPATAKPAAKPATAKPAAKPARAKVAAPAAVTTAPAAPKLDDIRPAAIIATIKGRSEAATRRRAAWGCVVELAYAEGASREATIENLKIALGDKPAPDAIQAARNAWMIGRMAARFPASALPAGAKTLADRLDFADRTLSGTVKKSEAVRKVYNAAREAWSKLLAETGHGMAQTQTAKNAGNKAKVEQAIAGASTGGNRTNAGQGAVKDKGPIMTALADAIAAKGAPAKPAPSEAPKDKLAAVTHIAMQAAAILAYANKYAGKVPGDLHKALVSLDKLARAERAVATAEKDAAAL